MYSDGCLTNNNPTLQSFTVATNLLRELNQQKRGEEETQLKAMLSLGCSQHAARLVDHKALLQLAHLGKLDGPLDYLTYGLNLRGCAALVETLYESATD